MLINLQYVLIQKINKFLIPNMYDPKYYTSNLDPIYDHNIKHHLMVLCILMLIL